MKIPHTHRCAFTLIELVIVTLILIILSGTVYSYISRIAEQRQWLQSSLRAREGAIRAVRGWRDDVLLASNIDVADGGHSMTISREDAEQNPYTIQYELDSQQRFVRRVERSGQTLQQATAFAELPADVDFERAERGYRLSCRFYYNDGLRDWSWQNSALAVPLNPALEENR